MSPAGSLEMGLNSPPNVPSLLLSDEDATPRPDGEPSPAGCCRVG